MPTSQDPSNSLQQQFHHLLCDWDDYKTTIPRHRHRHSSDLNFTPDPIPSHLRSPHSGRRLFDAFEKATETPAAEPETSPPSSSSSCSSSLSSTSYEEIGLEGAERVTRSPDRGMLRWFAILMAVFVFFFIRSVLAAKEVPQFVIPT